MNEASEIFEDAIRSLRDTYDDRPHFVERDIVYTVQLHLWKMVRERGLDWSIFNDYPMLPGPRRSLRNVPETTSRVSRNLLSSPPLGAKQGGGQHGRLCTGNRTEDEAAL